MQLSPFALQDCSTDPGFAAVMPSQVAELQPVAPEEADDLAWLDSAHGSSLPGMPAFAFEEGPDLQGFNRLDHAKVKLQSRLLSSTTAMRIVSNCM